MTSSCCRAGNQTYGMPRRSAYRICLPNFCALAATSVAMPRRRSAVATSSLAARDSSSTRATSTVLGTFGPGSRAPSANSGTSVRETPKLMPTPGYVVRPSLASASYRPPPATDFSRS